MIRLPTDKIGSLERGAEVVFCVSNGVFGRTQTQTGQVVRLTPTQVVVRYASSGRTIEVRFRKADGLVVGQSYGYLMDPENPGTIQQLNHERRNRRRLQIDALADRWARDRDNLDVLRKLQHVITEYLDAEES